MTEKDHTDRELFEKAATHMEKYTSAASLDRRLWDATARLARAAIASETEKQISPRTFDQIRDGIVSRMRGHTISRGDWSAYCNFMGLLAKVKESECFADAFFAGGERPRE